LAPGEWVICRPEFAGEWTIDRTYTTSAIHIEEGLPAQAHPRSHGSRRPGPRVASRG
jgi:hypothetical protein